MRTSIYRSLALAAAAVLVLTACDRRNPDSYIASGQSYLAKGEFNAAAIELKNALRDAPNRADARFLLARALLEGGDAQGAETEARKALELKYPVDEAVPLLMRAQLLQGEFRDVINDPAAAKIESPAARASVDTLRGLAYLALGDRKAASAALDSALAAQANHVPAMVGRVRLAIAENDPAAAMQRADAVLALAPAETEALVLKAEILAQAGRQKEGLVLLEQAVAAKADSAPARWALIIALVNDRNADAAAPHLAAAKTLAPDNPRTWYAEALVAYSRGDLAAARPAVERAKHFAPDYLPAVYLSGLIDLRSDSLANAESALRTVVAQMPGDSDARRALASVYIRRGKAAQALEVLDPLVKQTPNDPALLRQVAEAHLAGNNTAQATEQISKANKLDSSNVGGRIRLAQVRLASGDTAQAFKDLEMLAANESTSSEPDLALISAHLSRREFDKALAAVAALERKQPTNPLTFNVKGVVHMTRGDNKNARASFEKALAFDPNYADAIFNLARIDMLDRDYGAARKRFDRLLAKDPQSEKAYLGLAEMQMMAGAPSAEVQATLDRAIAVNPRSAPPRLALIAMLGQQGDWKAAIAAATAADTAIKDNPQIVEALGMARFGAGEVNQAIATLKRAAQLSPDNPMPWLRLAEAQARTKDYDGAIDSLRTLTDAQPDLGAAATALASVYVDSGRSDAGIDFARRVQKQRSDKAIGYTLEGDIRVRQARFPEAVTAYRAAQARQPTPLVATRLYGALDGAGRRDDANAVAQQWIKDHPSDVLMRAFVGEQHMGRKEYRLAAPYLRSAAELDPENVLVLNNLAWTLGEMGDAKAVEYAARAYALAPGNPEVVDTYGWVLVQAGNHARGIEILRQAAEMAPGDPGKRLHLAQALIKSGNKAAARKELEMLTSAQTPAAARSEAQKLLSGL